VRFLKNAARISSLKRGSCSFKAQPCFMLLLHFCRCACVVSQSLLTSKLCAATLVPRTLLERIADSILKAH
jgi:hypothetical protein